MKDFFSYVSNWVPDPNRLSEQDRRKGKRVIKKGKSKQNSRLFKSLNSKIENCLFTRKGEVLGAPGIGCNLDELVFSLVLNENTIQNNINSQITAYCLPDVAGFDINTKVSFFSTLERNGCLVDIFVNEQRVIGALF